MTPLEERVSLLEGQVDALQRQSREATTSPGLRRGGFFDRYAGLVGLAIGFVLGSALTVIAVRAIALGVWLR
jgi:hypothetical protein